MSNHLAIATVTGSLRRLLDGVAGTAVPGARAGTRRPDASMVASQAGGINIFLYQVTANAAYRNEDLPTRRSTGELAQRPRAALALHYLLSFFGEDEKLEPQRLMGAAIRHLHARPQLSSKDISDTIANPPYASLLATSNLAEQLDRVRFTPLGLSLDELSKVWSTFFQTPYLLSVAYQAGPVLIETDEEPRSALPVQIASVDVRPFRSPLIEEVVPEGEAGLIYSTSTVLVRGRQLLADRVTLLVGGVEQAPQAVAERQVSFTLPVGIRAGVHALQVVQKVLLGPEPKTLHRGFESNVASFVLTPRITGTTPEAGPKIKVDVDVIVGKEQRVVLLLDGSSSANTRSYSLLVPERSADASSVTVDLASVAAGTYFARVQIDGAASSLDLEQGSPTFGPTVTRP